jgi:Flp pilus assembly protein TadG
MTTTVTQQPWRRHRKQSAQRGAAMIELAIYLMMMLVMLGGGLQLGRALYAYHTLVTAAHSAALYLATAPDLELKTKGKLTATALVNKMMQDGGIDTSSNSVDIIVQCVPVGSAPCSGPAMPTKVTVRLAYRLTDQLLPQFTWFDNLDIVNINLAAQVTMPRVGFW